jgi:hypothetical protein
MVYKSQGLSRRRKNTKVQGDMARKQKEAGLDRIKHFDRFVTGTLLNFVNLSDISEDVTMMSEIVESAFKVLREYIVLGRDSPIVKHYS